MVAWWIPVVVGIAGALSAAYCLGMWREEKSRADYWLGQCNAWAERWRNMYGKATGDES